MRKLVSIYPYNGKQYLQNSAFDEKKNKGIEASIFINLKKFLDKKNIDINTYDIKKNKKPDWLVCFDLPYPWDFHGWRAIFSNLGKNILICNESSLIIPFNYWKVLHIFFNKVFQWYEKGIDNKKYFKMLLPKSSYGINIRSKRFSDKKFLVMINKNTAPFPLFQILSSFGKELYTERIKALEYFEKHTVGQFYLYGRGWNKPKKYSLSEKIFGYKKYKCYCGEIGDKLKLLSNFKFAICFENLTDVNGYITEKIFDCLKAKCVPIYWGSMDIEKYIPKNCFIDYRKFMSYDKLLFYLSSMDEKTYSTYIKNIKKLLSDKSFYEKWFEEGFTKFFYSDILKDKNYE